MTRQQRQRQLLLQLQRRHSKKLFSFVVRDASGEQVAQLIQWKTEKQKMESEQKGTQRV